LLLLRTKVLLLLEVLLWLEVLEILLLLEILRLLLLEILEPLLLHWPSPPCIWVHLRLRDPVIQGPIHSVTWRNQAPG